MEAEEKQKKDNADRLRRAINGTLRDWLERPTFFSKRFLVASSVAVAAWAIATDRRGTEWWRPAAGIAPASLVALPSKWGPFRAKFSTNARLGWLNDVVRILISGIAAVWLYMGEHVQQDEGKLTEIDLESLLDELETRINTFWNFELLVRWAQVQREVFFWDLRLPVWSTDARRQPGPTAVAYFIREQIKIDMWNVALGVGDSNTLKRLQDTDIVIDVDSIHTSFTNNENIREVYNRSLKTLEQKQWRPSTVQLRSDSMLPDTSNEMNDDDADVVPAVVDPYLNARHVMDNMLMLNA